MAGPSINDPERSPLLPQLPTASISSASKSSRALANPEATQRNDPAPTISALRGTLVAASIGLLIFLQGRSQGEIIFILLLLNTSPFAKEASFSKKINYIQTFYILSNLNGCRLRFGSC